MVKDTCVRGETIGNLKAFSKILRLFIVYFMESKILGFLNN